MDKYQFPRPECDKELRKLGCYVSDNLNERREKNKYKMVYKDTRTGQLWYTQPLPKNPTPEVIDFLTKIELYLEFFNTTRSD